MAIQKINLGTEPLGEGGDTYRSANTKINENFSNTTHAASRLVGLGTGQVPLAEQVAKAVGSTSYALNVNRSFDDMRGGDLWISSKASNPTMPPNVARSTMSVRSYRVYENNGVEGVRFQIGVPYGQANQLYFRNSFTPSEGIVPPWLEWVEIYHTGNTTKDSATGFLKASSPVLHVYNDSITKIHEAEQLDIKVDKKGVGHYEIHGTTGLRKNDGWFMSPPRDMHSNVLCMVDYEEKDGVIILKTYKKKFDFETVSIVHDYDNPMDIPEGACVEFRFNDLPQEDLGEFPTTEDK